MTVPARVRLPAVAGGFYSARGDRCLEEARRLCRPAPCAELPVTLVGAVVPHAGWVYSGRVAGATLATLAERTAARVVVLTGSVHTWALRRPATDDAARWSTPLGEVAVDRALCGAIEALDGFSSCPESHHREHSLEVQVPLLQVAFGTDVRIAPCLIPAAKPAVAWGTQLGRLLADWPEPVVTVASSDLTHYGPAYGFAPRGSGSAGHRWAHETNDVAFLDRVTRLEAAEALSHASTHHSACGGGAVAATIAACRAMGASRGVVLMRTDSGRVAESMGAGPHEDSVGYAGVVFG